VGAPEIRIDAPDHVASGETLRLSAEPVSGDPPVAWSWAFGGWLLLRAARKTSHAWTDSR